MQIPDEVRKCVVFLGLHNGIGPDVCGTAFFVTRPAGFYHDHGFLYLVTARHVIDGAAHRGTDGRVYVRSNLVGAGAEWSATERRDWVTQPEDDPEYSDVAILSCSLDGNVVDYRAVPPSMFATQEVIDNEKIGLGDELFITGLFVNHFGQQRNSPIVRIGNIAGMPEEPVRTKQGRMAAYLVEARSLGGLSGSPVFVSLGGVRTSGNATVLGAGLRFFLLGMMRGHWDRELEPEGDAALDSHLRQELVNMGVAIVVPAEKINKIIDQPGEMEERERWKKPDAPTEDAAAGQRESLTRDEFYGALGKIKKEPEEADKGAG
jgi:hypothetical protein